MSDEPRGRAAHIFRFGAQKIADACAAEMAYHRDRLKFWQVELDVAVARVKETASIEVKEHDVTGGKRIDVGVNYGDAQAHRRMMEAQDKIATHRREAERFERERDLYRTQGADYELTQEDTHYFRLGGGERDE